MVEAIVRQFTPEALASDLDFSGLELVNPKFHTRRHSSRRRESDVIWRLPTQEGTDIYLYLLFEFQSQSDWWMAVRTQVYQGLLWQQIIAEKKLQPGARLPPLMLLVLYNGKCRWAAPLETGELIAIAPDSELWPWQPRVRYYLLDMGALHPDDLVRRTTLATLLCRLEQQPESPDLEELLDEVMSWFDRHRDMGELKHLFAELIRGIFPDEKRVPLPDPLQEIKMIRSNLLTLVPDWKKKFRAEGLAEGKVEGKVEGKAESLVYILVERFGALSPPLRERISKAELPALETWLKRAITAPDVASVFDPPR
jgi:hypothetical protein